jgi:rubrerythrin
MFNKKDYQQYFEELYAVELKMKEEVDDLLKIVNDPSAVKILKKIKADEIKHAKIVQGFMKLLK